MAIRVYPFVMRFSTAEKRNQVKVELEQEFPELEIVSRDEAGPAFFLDFDITQLHERLIKTKWGG